MKRIAIDMDEVIADTFGARLKRYNETFDASFEPDDFKGKSLFEVIPEEHRDIMKIQMREPGFFIGLEVIQGAQEVIRELSEHYEVFIATAAMEGADLIRQRSTSGCVRTSAFLTRCSTSSLWAQVRHLRRLPH